ncbi:hypothetical protein BT67DRAFT_300711 [Trichocladium antarcticum]|uniref:Uncharacterized protein n=1 Tax=Trichocladium antarcticum TaxID=1450529 RepID=A0AAN6ZEC4_9PEZI|nr:hypothetical protein BT67DRAFT_300711 [Trichocladium antarcticum]
MFDGPTTPAGGSPFTIPTFTPPPHTTLQQLTADLDLALQRQWASRQQTRFSKYESVKAFLVSWEGDDLGVEQEVNDLARLFEHTYSYQVEKWKIPSRNSQIALDWKIADLVGELDRSSTLLIFHYAGHARPSRQHFGSYPVWRSSRTEDAEEVIPVAVQRYLESASADVLFLFDCSHPIHAQSGLKTQGITEVLAAGGFETVAAEAGDHSFSRILIDQLARASLDCLSISASELHGRMLTGMADYLSKLVRDNAGRIALDANNRPWFERTRRNTPMHYFMSQKHESIILAPLRRAAAEPVATARTPSANKDSHRMAPEIGEGIINLKPRKPHSQVILRVRLESSEDLNTEAWVDWLKDAPPSAKEIKVEGWFGSF